VHIAGEVVKPGAVELVSQNTVSLMKVVAVAGGLTRTASARKTLIMHINSEGVQTSRAFINLGKIMSGKAKDLELSPGDIVVVPSNTVMSYLQAASLSTLSTGIYILGRF
jgi:polysaccharide export outer membrane protein